MTAEGGRSQLDAVHVDGLTGLATTNCPLADTHQLTTIIWLKSAPIDNAALMWVSNPDVFAPYANFTTTTVLAANLNDGDSSLSIGGNSEDLPQLCDGTWHVQIMTADTQVGDGAIYIGDHNSDAEPIPNSPFSMTFHGLPFKIFDDGFEEPVTNADVAMVWLIPNQYLKVGGEIPEAARRLFIDADGKPVDPAVARAALSITGDILFYGNAANWGFASLGSRLHNKRRIY
jgi:hypothetical protein